MKKLLVSVVAGVVLLGMAGLTNAALTQIGTANYGGNNYNLIYEGEMNGHGLIWLDYSKRSTDWTNALIWAAGLNTEGVLTYSMNSDVKVSWDGGWRLPQVLPVNGSSYTYILRYDGSTDYGFSISAPGSAYTGSKTSEMPHLFYTSLGNKGFFDLNGNGPQGGYGLQDTGPFHNLQDLYYWSSEYGYDTSRAWVFFFRDGSQSSGAKNYEGFHALAVRPADLSSVPIPNAVWLLGSGLIGLVGLRRRLSNS